MADLCERCHDPIGPDREGCDPGLCEGCTELAGIEERLRVPRPAVGREGLARALYEDGEGREPGAPAWEVLASGDYPECRRAWLRKADRILAALGGPPAPARGSEGWDG